jgi:hypothetical protein
MAKLISLFCENFYELVFATDRSYDLDDYAAQSTQAFTTDPRSGGKSNS